MPDPTPVPSPCRLSRRGLSRRRFVPAAAAWLAAPAIVGATDKAGTRPPLVGAGDWTFECHHDWGRDALPAGAGYGNASHGVAIDAAGLLYVTHYGQPGSIFVFDPAGRFVRSLGDVHVLGKAGRGHGIDIRREGSEEFLYVSASDTALGFAKLSLDGEVVWSRDLARLREETGRYDGDKPRFRPTNTSFAPDGGYFLGDGYGSDLVHQFDAADAYVRTIGGTGQADGQFRTPHGQWLDDRDGVPKLVVADRANKRLQWFDLEGRHHATLDGFLFPADIDIRGDVMAVPDLHCRVTLLDRDNQVLAQLGDDPEWRARVLADPKIRGRRDEWPAGRFVHPHDACFDAAGNLFVAEWVVTGRLTKLVRVG
jgi:hypothetical protein